MKIGFKAVFYTLIAIGFLLFARTARATDKIDPEVAKVDRLFKDCEAREARDEIARILAKNPPPPAEIVNALGNLEAKSEKFEKYREWASIPAVLCAVASLFWALRIRKRLGQAESASKKEFIVSPPAIESPASEKEPKSKEEATGQILVGIWVIVPAIFFIAEWHFWSYGQELEVFKHSQELARNFWIALVALLVAILRGKLPSGSEPD